MERWVRATRTPRPPAGPVGPGSVSRHEPTEILTETGSSHSGSGLDQRPQSSSPATGEKVYRCPVSSDFTAAQTASLSFHLDRYHFPHWEGWSPAEYLGLENHSENALLINKQPDITDKDAAVDTSLSAPTRKSQYEPLDLSVRPDSVMSHSGMSPAELLQMAGVFSNGLSSSLARRLQSYSNAAAELGVKPAYQCDLLVQGIKGEMNALSAGSTGHNGEGEFEKSEQGRDDENDDAAKWKVLRNNILEPEEMGEADFQIPGEKKHEKAGPWGRAVAESPISSLENLTPGQADQLQHQGGLLSYLRSQGNMSSTHNVSPNHVGSMETDVASGRKPFQCRYCPYSASQKGNLKTHVLCVHRKPFDNSLYPDRRLRRSHQPQRPSRLPQSIMRDNRVAGRDQIGMTSLCGT
ncbi:hypothetical protein KUCAC02_021097 [Chaenocephalus aceratus]|uniref:Uncharacterized protein n=1 Tax=Chaenocephalus aceratus TaxID=36190 RepID=A0ACB9XFR0_CHAAC|nr:hypothetical protein KUCAC02_021097 [Chaenocephalus aceratus]